MDISKSIAELKKRPDFIDKVGMVLVHNGTVRNWSRGDGRTVVALETEVDTEKVESLRQEYKKHQGIYEILVEARSGKFYPGDDLLFIIVAGDLRENVKSVLSEILDRIKAEAVRKKEICVSL